MLGCLGVVAAVVVAGVLWVSCQPSHTDLLNACPDATQAEIAARVGAPEVFYVDRARSGDYQVEGAASVNGRDLWWDAHPTRAPGVLPSMCGTLTRTGLFSTSSSNPDRGGDGHDIAARRREPADHPGVHAPRQRRVHRATRK